MKSCLTIVLFAFVCTLGAGLVAHSQDTPSTAANSANKEHSMTGCLQKGMEPNTFQLTNLEKGPKTVEIAETTAKLDPHVGHKVEITGTATVGKDPKAHTMKVTSVKMIGPTCP